MFIVPLNSSMNINNINTISPNLNKTESKSGENGDLGFKEIFQDAIKNVEETEAVTQMDAYNLSIGNMDDMHNMIINAAKADVALQTMVQLRNKLLDAYSEVMKTNL